MHTPVLPAEILSLLAPKRGETYIDCTAGLGGHASLIAPHLEPGGTIILNDVDPGNLERAVERVRGAAGRCRVEGIRGNFAELPPKLVALGVRADVVLADLGFSSNQIEDAGRGFSFLRDGPLDMRLDPTLKRSALDAVGGWSERELARVIAEYGEDREAKRIARKLVEARAQEPITSTQRLAEVVRSVFGRSGGKGGIHPATRTFQALRIAVNDQIGCLEAFLSWVERGAEATKTGNDAGWLRRGARVGIIAFHSLEDRPVKRVFGSLAERGLVEALTRGPVRAGEAEESSNPRSRSAKLRVVKVV